MQAADQTLGLQLQILLASTERDFDTVFSTMAQLRASAGTGEHENSRVAPRPPFAG